METFSLKINDDKDLMWDIIDSFPDKNMIWFSDDWSYLDQDLVFLKNSDLRNEKMIKEIHDAWYNISQGTWKIQSKKFSWKKMWFDSLEACFSFLDVRSNDWWFKSVSFFSMDDALLATLNKDEHGKNILSQLYTTISRWNHDRFHNISRDLNSRESREFIFWDHSDGNFGDQKYYLSNDSNIWHNYEYMSLLYHYYTAQAIFKKKPELLRKIETQAVDFVDKVDTLWYLSDHEKEYLIGMYGFFLCRFLHLKRLPTKTISRLKKAKMKDSFAWGWNGDIFSLNKNLRQDTLWLQEWKRVSISAPTKNKDVYNIRP